MKDFQIQQEPTALQNPDMTDLLSILEGPSSVQPVAASSFAGQIQLVPQSAGLPVRTPSQSDTASDLVLFQPAARLSRSKIWDILTDFYSTKGIEAWQGNVPFLITNSTVIAESYAEMVISFLLDALPDLNLDEPIYLLEMATGTGRFSFYLLKELMNKLHYFEELRAVKLRYVMTDFTEANIQFWEQHEKFKPFIEAGILDFAVYVPERFDTLKLRLANTMLTRQAVKNPIIAVANYFFDSIRQDIFRVKDGRLEEGRISLYREKENAHLKPHMEQIRYHYTYHPAQAANYYPDAEMNRILEAYVEMFRTETGNIIFPIGALNCLKNLQTLSNNKLMLISSDKGFTDSCYMQQVEQHGYALHGGAFSYMVNYDAVQRFFGMQGGQVFGTSEKSLSLETVCCVSGATTARPMQRLGYLFKNRLSRVNTVNFVLELHGLLRNIYSFDLKNQKLEALISYIRMSLCDPMIFFYCAPMLMDCLDVMNYKEDFINSYKSELLEIFDTVWENYYYFSGEVNIPFWLGQFYYMVQEYNTSLAFFETALVQFGPHEALYFLMAEDYERLNDPEAAMAHYEKALDMKPDFAEAQANLDKLRQAA